MGIVTAYRHGSGPSIDNACFLGDRYDEGVGIGREKSECWVLAARKSADPKPGHVYDLRFQRGSATIYTGLWRSPKGRVWVSDAGGFVHSNEDVWAKDSGARWTTHDNFFRMRVNGVWGLDDDNVFVWLDHQGTPVVRSGPGRPNWGHLGDMNARTGPGFGFQIAALHGTAPDHVLAVGTGGRIVRWNGRKWTQEECPVQDDLLSVFVVSADEAWATSAGGALLCFDGKWSVIASDEKPLVAVAKWRGQVWTGGESGLLRLDGATLRQIKASQTVKLDARDELLVTTRSVIACSADGEGFRALGKEFLLNARANIGLLADFGAVADDRAKVAHALDLVSDQMFGYDVRAVNLENMDDGDFDSLVVECCEKLGIAEPPDLAAVPRDADRFVDYFRARWDGKTIR